MQDRAIICYLSFSGNTEELADLIEGELHRLNIVTEKYDIFNLLNRGIPDMSKYKYKFFGTFTWDRGSTPDDMKDFVLDLGYKPDNVAIFGSGDTQFGGDNLFCLAAEKLAKFYSSNWAPLKIEQSPRGSQELLISNWVDSIVKS